MGADLETPPWTQKPGNHGGSMGISKQTCLPCAEPLRRQRGELGVEGEGGPQSGAAGRRMHGGRGEGSTRQFRLSWMNAINAQRFFAVS